LTGPLQFIMIRQGGEIFRAGGGKALMPSVAAAMLTITLVALVFGGIFFGFFCEGGLVYKFGSVSLLVFVSLCFVGVAYLGAMQRYRWIVRSFFVGYLFACLVTLLAAIEFGVEMAVLSFALGHCVLLAVILWVLGRIQGEIDALCEWSLFDYLKRYPELAVCGLFYNFGIWGDKLLFWWLAHDSQSVNGFLRAAPNYDMAIYLSLLSIGPGFAVFFMVLETKFSGRFHKYFETISSGGNLDDLKHAKEEVMKTLQESFGKLITLQGFTTVILLILSRPIGRLLSIGSLQVGIFQVTLIGAFLLILFLSILTVLFYFDDRIGAMWSTLVFGVGNFALSYLTLLTTEAWYGVGFVLACAAGVAIAGYRMNLRFINLEFNVFHPS